MSFGNLLKYRDPTFLQKIISNKEPSYLFKKLSFLNSIRLNNNIKMIRLKYQISERQFLTFAIRPWDLLPNRLKIISNPLRFKKFIKEYITVNPYSTDPSGNSITFDRDARSLNDIPRLKRQCKQYHGTIHATRAL